MNLLIIDDEIDTANYLASVLEKNECGIDKIEVVYSAKKAMELISSDCPDIILCDIEMPQMSGLALLEWLSDMDCNYKFIILSCHERFDYAVKAIEHQVNFYLTKPIDEVSIVNAVSNCVKIIEAERKQKDYLPGDEYAQEADDIIRKVKEYVKEHYSEDISRGTLASTVFLTPNYLSALFRKKTGQSLSEYISKYRVSAAKKMLKSRNVPVCEIAWDCGFNNITYFSTIFKKEVGLTPSEYRNQLPEEP